ncbi:MAG: hypothetical protein JNM93_08145 [Bacteriovoracaceae bacterium]|nr:hypothetical protein [Bacteriovoracaceae bacterium]
MKLVFVLMSLFFFNACMSDAEQVKQAETGAVPSTLEDCDDKAKKEVTSETVDLTKSPDQGCTLE